MKKMLTLIALMTVVMTSFSQTTEGKVSYTIDFKTEDPVMQAQLGMLKGSTMAMYFSPAFNRTEMNMGMFMQNTTVVDIKGQESMVLMSGMMGKKATKMSTKSDAAEEKPEVQVEKTTETKKIAGYKCTKYIVSTEDGSTLNMWTTEELAASKDGLRFSNDKVSGFPLEFEVDAQGLTMVFSANAVEKSLKKYNAKDLFSMTIPSDYEVVAPEDFKGMEM